MKVLALSRNCIHRSLGRSVLFFGSLVLPCFVTSPTAQAVNPPPDGGYANFTTAEGTNALLHLTGGAANTAVGWYSLFSAGGGSFNTGIGAGTLFADTGDSNTAVGAVALFRNTTGTQNTAVGTGALVLNTSGGSNAAVGAFALYHNTASGNTAVGGQALFSNTTGVANTAIGDQALLANTTANGNTAIGTGALANNTGADNTAIGDVALVGNTTGTLNTSIGVAALGSNTTGANNTAEGYQALMANTTGAENTAVGLDALSHNTTGAGNTAVGVGAGLNVTTANSVICIGTGIFGEDVTNTTWIGGVYGVMPQNQTTLPVVVSVNGQLGVVVSSERFKKDIATMERASEAILALRPVTFHYETDKEGTAQFGLIAEEVEKVNPDLVVRDKQGKPYSVRYDQVNAMLLNEFLKEHCKTEKLEATVAQQQKQIEALAAGLQKVSAQLELSKAAPQTASNDQ